MVTMTSNMTMKYFKYIMVIVATLLATTACHHMLDQDPRSEHEEDQFGRNDEEVGVLVNGCYNGMQLPLETEWKLTELRSDNSLQGSPNSTSTTNIYLNYLDMFSLNATHPDVYEYWYSTYQNVESINNMLSKLPNVEDTTLRKQYQGEGLFIRSYHYFNLVRLFGPIFIHTEKISAEEAKLKNRIPVFQVYERIIEDLQNCITLLPESYGKGDLGRTTSWAAKALLAKVYLTNESLEEARVLLQDIIDNSYHELLSSYENVFSISNEMNNEIIFAVRYKSGSVGLGSKFANWFAPSSSGSNVVNGNGSGYNYPTSSLNGAYAPEDNRKNVNIERYVSAASSKLYVNKYISYVQIRYDAENDWPVLRYSDVLLMYAEVLGKLQGPSAGLPYLNQVKTRAGLSAIPSMVSIDDFIDEVLNERRLELAFENDRWFDLLRSGKAISILRQHIIDEAQHYNSTGYSDEARNIMKNVQEWQLMLPIPQREIDTNNKVVIVQNTGY